MPRPKQPLIRPAEAVVVALAVIDRDGLNGFNIRKLACELGVNPSSLYYHFHDKNEILNRVCRLVLDEGRVIAPLRVQASWQDYVKKSVTRYRRALMAHPNVAPLMTPTGPLGRFSDSIAHRGITVLLEQGVPAEYTYAIVDSINSLAYGSAMLNPLTPEEGQQISAAKSESALPDEVIRSVPNSPDRVFEMQIDALLEGWTATLERAQTQARSSARKRTTPRNRSR
jgi:TetR/AcrR family tetracycline transcriptional repressor